MSELLTQLGLLRRVVAEVSDALPWCGSQRFHKAMYVLEHAYHINLGYHFGFHHYGPFSYDLANSLSLGEQAGFWESETRFFEGRDGVGGGKQFRVKRIKLPEQDEKEIDARWRRVRPKIEHALSKLHSMSSTDLELVATIHYLQHVQKVKSDVLYEVFRRLKPKFTKDQYEWGQEKVRELKHSSASAA